MTTLRNILIGLMILISARLSAEPIGDIISYQGKLTNADGTPVANGTQSVTFKIYENGSAVFTRTSSVATVGGVFSAFLSLAGQINFDPAKQYEMGVTFGGAETKSNIASVPFAIGNVSKTGDTMSGNLTVTGKGVFDGGVHSDMRSVSNSTAVNGEGLNAGVRGYSPVGKGVWAEVQDGVALAAFANGNAAIFTGHGPGGVRVCRIDSAGKGFFNGGVYSDMRGKGSVTAIDGVSDDIGVRGYSPVGKGVWAEVQDGVALAAFANGNAAIFTGHGPGGVRVCRIDSAGKGFFNGGTQTGGADYADLVTVKGKSLEYQPGDVLVISNDPACPFTKDSIPYSKNVAGIYSTKPGVIGSKRGIEPAADNEVPLALTGIVPCKVSCENGPIRMGDLLVTSRTSGYAMKGTDRSKMLGAVLGKALQPLASGKGVVEVLVTQR